MVLEDGSIAATLLRWRLIRGKARRLKRLPPVLSSGNVASMNAEAQIVAIAMANGRLNSHFGQSRAFRIYHVSKDAAEIVKQEEVLVPENGSGCSLLAVLLKQQGVSSLICGGMGGGAANHLRGAGIEPMVVRGETDPEKLVRAFLKGDLQSVGITCQGHHGHGHHGHGQGHGHHGGGHRHCGCHTPVSAGLAAVETK